MQVFVVEVRYGSVERGIEKVIRYAILSIVGQDALRIIQTKFGHGDRARLLDETLPPEEAARFNLRPDTPCIIG